MPELGPNNRNATEELTKALRITISGKVNDILKKYNYEFVGKGSECIVVSYEGRQHKVTAFNYETGVRPVDAKNIFYLQRIFSILFPHNFPHFYASSGVAVQTPGHLSTSGTVRERVFPKDYPKLLKILRSVTRFPRPKYPFRLVKKACEEMDIDFKYDGFHKNFIIGTDGGEYYVDTLRTMRLSRRDGEKIIRYMSAHGYSEEDKRSVQLAVERLNEALSSV